MTTRLEIGTGFATGRVETLAHDWPGWDSDAAGSVMRARTHAIGGGLVYYITLDQGHREAGVVRVTHKWTDPECAATEVAS